MIKATSVSILLFLFLSFLSSSVLAAIDTDLNDDGINDWQDILRVIREVAFKKGTDEQADVNEDGVIDNYDLLIVMVFAASDLEPGQPLLPEKAVKEFLFLSKNQLLRGDINDNGVVSYQNDIVDYDLANINNDGWLDIIDLVMIGQQMPGEEPNRTAVTPAIERMDLTHDKWITIDDMEMAGKLIEILPGSIYDHPIFLTSGAPAADSAEQVQDWLESFLPQGHLTTWGNLKR